MTRALYESFVCVRTITKNAKRKTPGSETANYVCFACPHCKFEVEVPETCVQRRKSSECKAHLAICPVLTESRNEAERKEAKQRHDQLISQLTERSEQLSGIQDQLTDVQQQLSDKRQCLADVREWASLKEPDSTLVPQLACREMKLLGPLKSEVETLKTVNSVLNERSPVALMQRAIEAENRAQKAESALLLEKQRAQKLNVASRDARETIEDLREQLQCSSVSEHLPPALLAESRHARKYCLIAFHPDKQPSDHASRLAAPLYNQASAAEPSRSSDYAS